MAADGEAEAKLSKSQKALSRQLRERMAASLLPGEAALTPDRLAEAAEFMLEAALVRDKGEPSLLLRSAAGGRFMRIAVVNDDMPFLVDSIASTVAAGGLAIDLLVHPIVPAARKGGELVALAEGGANESMIYLETARVDAKERRALEKALETTLGDVRAAVADWPAMVARIEADAGAIGDPEGAALLR